MGEPGDDLKDGFYIYIENDFEFYLLSQQNLTLNFCIRKKGANNSFIHM